MFYEEISITEKILKINIYSGDFLVFLGQFSIFIAIVRKIEM